MKQILKIILKLISKLYHSSGKTRDRTMDGSFSSANTGVSPDRIILKCPFVLLLLLFCSAYADPTTLQSINKNIATIQTDLKKSHQKKSQLQQALQQTQTTEQTVQQKLQKTQSALQTKNTKLSELKQLSVPLQTKIAQDKTLLKQQIRAAYIYNQQPYLKLILSPDGVTEAGHTLMYFHYIALAETSTIQELQRSVAAYQKNQQQVSQQYSSLVKLKSKQVKQQLSLEQTQQQRRQLIAQLNSDIQTKNEKLQTLLRNKKALEKTVEKLNTAATTSIILPSHAPFSKLRGKLGWPVSGEISAHFGTQVMQSELRWDGVVVRAPVGSAVRAVATGSVLFAKWMTGYGLLVIINHGNGYMTLYGRNQSLSVHEGQTVVAGQTIAAVGQSEEFKNPSLYFSIRYNGKPVNPEHWCR